MATYVRIRNTSAGTVQVDDDNMNLAVRESGTASIPSGSLSTAGSYSGGTRKLLAVKSAVPMRAQFSGGWFISKKYGDASALSANWWIFDAPLLSSATVGLRVWKSDGSGQLMFDSGNRHMHVVGMITTYGSFTFPSGRDYAVVFMKNSFHRKVTWYHQGNNLYHYDVEKFKTFAKVVNNVVTVSKEESSAPWIYRDEPVGQVGVGNGFDDAAFVILVLDVTGFPVGFSSGVSHEVTVADLTDATNAQGAVTKTMTASVSGGVGPFSYSWEFVGNHPGIVILSGGTTATVTIQSTGYGQQNTGVIRCTVVDLGNSNMPDDDTGNISLTHQHNVNITNKTYAWPAALIGFRLAGGGKLRYFSDLNGPFDEDTSAPTEWLDPENTATGFMARAVSVSGTLSSRNNTGGVYTSVANGDWTSIGGSARDWWNPNQGTTASFTVQIAHQDNLSNILDSAVIVLNPQNTITNHTVSVANNIDFSEPNGTTDRVISATVANGVGPFTYLWEWVGTHTGLSFVGSTTSSSVTIRSTGTNQQNNGTHRCTVIDQGNSNYSAYDDGSSVITHGTPP